jgi:hypothetical protein
VQSRKSQDADRAATAVNSAFKKSTFCRKLSKTRQKTSSFNYGQLSTAILKKIAMRVAVEDTQPMLCPTIRLKECEDLPFENDLKYITARRMSNTHEYCYDNNINIIKSEMRKRRFVKSQSMVPRSSTWLRRT